MPELNLDEYLALNDVEFTTGELSKASDVISHHGVQGQKWGTRLNSIEYVFDSSGANKKKWKYKHSLQKIKFLHHLC